MIIVSPEKRKRLGNCLFAWCFALVLIPQSSAAYSVLTHEALIDANWDKVLVPLLKQKFPFISPAALQEAHSYAYGGAVVPDMGYYPTGSRLFTELLHYVRSGDFTEALFEEAGNSREYAFALGVLCHYHADRYGHSIGINTAVPLIYPKMKEKYGDTVTWSDDHISHIRTEFSFDVLQTARGVYASAAYQDFIGFRIADTVMMKAFFKTYGLPLQSLLKNLTRTINLFRWTVSNLLPFITRSALANKKKQIQDSFPGVTAKSFIYRMKIKNYNKQYDKKSRPGFLAYAAAGIIKILPKIGPLRVLHFRQPSAEAEKKFVRSFDTSSRHYAAVIGILAGKDIQLANIDFDTGNRTTAGEYPPADEAYSLWLMKLSDSHFQTLTPGIYRNIAAFYTDHTPAVHTKKQQKKWNKTRAALSQLKAAGDRL